jgi:predicted lysophospholipase L1 biosynthesis ABC-type transport system permease subunit
VTQRTGEIGVRLALGAEPTSVSRMIVRQGGLVAVAGITVGLAAALAGSRLIESLLYGVSSRDPRVFAITSVTLLAVALLACWLPARRAARLNPLEALRTDERGCPRQDASFVSFVPFVFDQCATERRCCRSFCCSSPSARRGSRHGERRASIR